MATQIKSVNGGTGVRMADGLDMDTLEIGCTLMDIDAYMTSLSCAKRITGKHVKRMLDNRRVYRDIQSFRNLPR